MELFPRVTSIVYRGSNSQFALKSSARL